MILVLAGPTASGKSGAAIAVAQQVGAVVLSADAMQVYRGMDIGTGKVTTAEQGGVLHFGLDLVAPDQAFDAADFVALADEVIARHRHVVVAGGTHLYLQALVRGLVRTPPVDPELRAELEQMPDLHAALREVDPVLAERLHPNDRVRLVRGLEVFRQTGQRLSVLQERHAAAADRHEVRGLWLDRDDLDARIDRRVLEMIEQGYVAEVQGLLDAGYTRDLKPMQSLGYRHLCDHLSDGVTLDEAIRRTQRDTRRFARKQRTWRKAFAWEAAGEDPIAAALSLLQR